MKHVWVIALLGLLCACGDKKEPAKTTPAKSGAQAASNQPDPAKAAEAKAAAEKERQEKRAALEQRKTELQAQIAELKKKLDGMDERHAKALADVGDLRTLRQRFVTKQRAMYEATSRYETMQKRFDEIKDVAEKASTAELRKLNDEMADVEKRYRDALSGWRDSLEETHISRAQASPVKRKLDALRLAKRQWFRATPAARAGTAAASERKIISDSYRAWLAEDEARKSVVSEVLAQPIAPKGTSPDSYDYTDLDFYVLMEIYEDILDRQNIAVEKKELGENAEKLKEIEAEMDKLRNEIAEKMAAGGGDLERYEDLRTRLPGQRKKAETLQRETEELHKSLQAIEDLAARQDKEADETARALDAAEQELKKVQRELR